MSQCSNHQILRQVSYLLPIDSFAVFNDSGSSRKFINIHYHITWSHVQINSSARYQARHVVVVVVDNDDDNDDIIVMRELKRD